ncbi:MAG: addiction module protein [Limisphaerales bacterium]
MTAIAEDLVAQAKRLSPAEREFVAEQLVASLTDEFDPALDQTLLVELERRRADYLAGRVETISLEEVMAQAHARLR